MKFIWLDSTDSTNTQAKVYGLQYPGPIAVAAGQQTAGRGTQGRVWASPAGCGLYLSLWLPYVAENPLLTQQTGGLVCQWLTTQGWGDPALGLKPVNDVMCGLKKLGGILAERTLQGHTHGPVVIGVGLNVITPNPLPSDYPDRALALDWLAVQPAELPPLPVLANDLALTLLAGLAPPTGGCTADKVAANALMAYHHWVKQWQVASQMCLS